MLDSDDEEDRDDIWEPAVYSEAICKHALWPRRRAFRGQKLKQGRWINTWRIDVGTEF